MGKQKSKNHEYVGIYDNNFNEIVYKEIEKGTYCLDIGCWTGNLGRALIKQKKCKIDGIDYYKNALKVAKEKNGYKNIAQLDLNKTNVLSKILKTHDYDYIIMADIIEHLINPEQLLQEIFNFYKTKTKKPIIIISIPNIAFIKQRIALLLGYFEYNKNGGIMDYTHLHFFTKGSLTKVLKIQGYHIDKSYGYSIVKNKYIFLKFLAKIFPTLFGIQLLFKLRVPNTQTKQ